MKPMLPILRSNIPENRTYRYEIKYDGYRGILQWTVNEIHLWSRNGKDLLTQFPEIEQALLTLKEEIKMFLPLVIDGELVILENNYKANFNQLQIRGRMRQKKRIEQKAQKRPCHYLAFDILEKSGKNLRQLPYEKRKEILKSLFQQLQLPTCPGLQYQKRLQYIPYETDFQSIWQQAFHHESEGIVAKQRHSKWETGKRSDKWVKIKNWKTVSCFITGHDTENGYFDIAVFKGQDIFPLGRFLFSMEQTQKEALSKIIKDNATKTIGNKFYIHPAICVEIHYLEWEKNQLREPHFKDFRFDLNAKDCTYGQFLIDEAQLPKKVTITHPHKLLWKTGSIQKLHYLRYLRKIAPFMLPFLSQRALTVIRYPHGMFGEPFFQKNCPDYAPDFIETFDYDGIRSIMCNDLNALIWLGNQLAIEFHLPFQKVTSEHYVSEIVFDLDPPSQKDFPLAVKAALMMKEIFDTLSLTSFIKTSGNKGLQVYIPLGEKQYTWEETRLFTSFIAQFLVSQQPDLFTVERLKKKRKGKLYIDYVQHAEGKTIIAPYSVRGNRDATVATPLFWDEVNTDLSPTYFTMEKVMKRVETYGCPFATYHHVNNDQPFAKVISMLKEPDVEQPSK